MELKFAHPITSEACDPNVGAVKRHAPHTDAGGKIAQQFAVAGAQFPHRPG